MKVARKEIEAYFDRCVVKYASTPGEIEKIAKECYKIRNMPVFRTTSILQLTEASSVEVKNAEMYFVLDAMKSIFQTDINLDKYYTEIEIGRYSKAKYQENETVVFPLVIPAIQNRDDQWMASVSARQLLTWRQSIMRYNSNIQRALTTIVRNGVTYEKITLNKASVKNMQKLFRERKYVPDVITVNIDDDGADFYYDEKEKALIINSVKYLDLTDGYHRLVALSKVAEEDPEFDYHMWLQITNFSESLASHFIWQVEQRNVMPKATIATYNMDDLSNKIVKRVNEANDCNLCGCITRGGMCDFTIFASVISYGIVRNIPEARMREALVTATKDIIKTVNEITEGDLSLLSRKMTTPEIRALAYCCCQFYGKKSKAGAYELFTKLVNAKERETDLAKTSLITKTVFAIFKERGGEIDV